MDKKITFYYKIQYNMLSDEIRNKQIHKLNIASL